MNGNTQHFALGSLVACASTAIPDELASFAVKVIAAVVLGLITGFASKIGASIAARLGKKP